MEPNKTNLPEPNLEHWTACPSCQGRGKKSQRLKKKVRLSYKAALDYFHKTDDGSGTAPSPPIPHQSPCTACKGDGIIRSEKHSPADSVYYPHVAIIGGGIGGTALAVACLHRGIPFTLYERDDNFEARSQGYGLTLQQASKAISGLGIQSLKDGVNSKRHLVHTPEGKVIGEWGGGEWIPSRAKTSPKRTNIHIARQSLRRELLEQLGGHDKVQWGHQLMDFEETADDVHLNFQVDGEIKSAKVDLLVGADGIRSRVRKSLIGEDKTPLQYLGCIVILGICPLDALNGIQSDLLDSATVFQTANGNERIYMMPFTTDTVMWQLSFPMDEEEARTLSTQGPNALKKEAMRRTSWHDPIPQILRATDEDQISGYPVYDRELLTPEMLDSTDRVTLIGDAAHPMSPFKGQGANQALLDALALARGITKRCGPYTDWKTTGLRSSVLNEFELAMIERSAIKVKDSADAAEFLHSDTVLHEANEPRGKAFKRKS